jgi:hypothetical protein
MVTDFADPVMRMQASYDRRSDRPDWSMCCLPKSVEPLETVLRRDLAIIRDGSPQIPVKVIVGIGRRGTRRSQDRHALAFSEERLSDAFCGLVVDPAVLATDA